MINNFGEIVSSLLTADHTCRRSEDESWEGLPNVCKIHIDLAIVKDLRLKFYLITDILIINLILRKIIFSKRVFRLVFLFSKWNFETKFRVTQCAFNSFKILIWPDGHKKSFLFSKFSCELQWHSNKCVESWEKFFF